MPCKMAGWSLRELSQSAGRSWVSLPTLSTWALSLYLLLNPVAVTAQSAADYYVSSLPGAPEGPLLKMHAG
jgi:carboxypeptidase D